MNLGILMTTGIEFEIQQIKKGTFFGVIYFLNND